MEAPPFVEDTSGDAEKQLNQSAPVETQNNSPRKENEEQIVISSEPNSPAKPAQDPASAAKHAQAGSQAGSAASQPGKSAFNAGPGKKRGRPGKKSLEAAAVGCGKGLSAFLVRFEWRCACSCYPDNKISVIRGGEECALIECDCTADYPIQENKDGGGCIASRV